ncbi:MAG: NTP transferase domain-containing protein [Candidatus Altiarchaeales archaeon]|nr:NTP transferase domain-containing protein [Candidatus Altiarchaeales archaeon]MBD3416613.1 NTP transferase domain-containing protein [Candidatus Altiarchaeales archaeon]
MVSEASRERLTITLRKDLLKELDSTVDGINVRNRSHAIEILISRVLESRKVRKAVILAGGKGTRMRPLTYEMPKPMIPLKGKPLVQHIIELCRKYDIREIIMSTGYLGEKIREHFGDGSHLGVDIQYVEEKEELGTAGPLRLAEKHLDGPFLMFNGDVLSDIDLSQLISFHTEQKATATIALTQVDDTSAFGVARLTGHTIVGFIEKPKAGEESKLINAGVYVLEPEVIDYIPKGKAMMETDVFPKLSAEGKLFGYPFHGQWFDTGTPEAYEKAIKNWKGII